MKNFINNNMSVVVLLVFILTGIFGIPAIIGATPNKSTINWNDSINIAHFNYMDSCWTVYETIDACYGVDNGDAFDMDYVDSQSRKALHRELEHVRCTYGHKYGMA